jgi:hypothetical protein
MQNDEFENKHRSDDAATHWQKLNKLLNEESKRLRKSPTTVHFNERTSTSSRHQRIGWYIIRKYRSSSPAAAASPANSAKASWPHK